MRAPASYAVATLTAALALACAGPGVATRSEAPARAAEPSTAAAASTRPPAPVQRFHAPLDPPPRFLDPDRRARIESAFPAVEDYLAGTVARDHLVGLAAGIVIDGELAWFHAWGHSDPARGLPIELDTRFGVGSISKTITAMAILKLRDEGRLQLDRPARVYLPELAQILYPSVDSPEITIRHLLTHSSGLPRMGAFPEYPASPPSRAEFLATLRGLGLERAPGLRRVYSNLGVQLLGPLVDNVAGVDHRTYTRDAILRPIGMAGAAWLPEHIPPDKLAVGHEFGPDRQPRARPHWRPGAADAAGGLYASVEDLARYAAYNLDAWPPRDGPERGPLRRATIREAHRLQVVSSMHFEPDGRGAASVWVGGTGHVFGVFSTCHHEYVVGHNGKTLNYRATLYMLPWQGVAVILLTNQSAISSRVLPSDGIKVLDLLADTGALAPRRHAPAPALLAAAGELGALVGRWDPGAHARVFSDDYRDAYPVSGTEREFARWRELVGACQDPQPVDIDEPRAGELELACERGRLRLALRVAPWAGAPVTELRFVGAAGLPAPAHSRDAAARALTLMRRWDDRAHARLFTPALGPARIRTFLAGVRQAFGDCSLGDPQQVLPGGVVYALQCERGEARMRVSLTDDAPPRIGGFEITRAPGTGPCG